MREKYLNFIATYRDTITKIFSLILAILLWFFIITEIDPVITKDFTNVEVELRNQSTMREAGMELLKNDVYTTNIVISGNRSAIIGLKEEDISAYVDLGEVQPGSQRLPIHFRLSDESLKIKKSNPTAITIAVDEMVTVKKPVTVTAKGQPAEGMVLDRITVNQEEVSVKGPKKSVDKVHSVAGYIPVTGAKDTVVSSVELAALDQNKNVIAGLEITPNTVGVQAAISKAKSVPIEINYKDDGGAEFNRDRAILTPPSVTITGDTEAIDQIERILTRPVDPVELMNTNAMPIELVVPEGIHLVNPDESILLRYMKKESSRRTLEVSTNNMSSAPGVNLSEFNVPKKIDVEIYGDASLVDAIRETDIQLTVDREGKVKANGPKGLEIIRITPKRLSSSS
ncbi:CdaR family protein [Aedoeadaptatus pacaensis]|uniref:CdaR family protein n=1 Tax=Aedoeadaptatus pacaensis TaxID=1776390 RepID=UPI0008390BF8|nr:CdaR family protein [Peptoniphilus pacaensis]